MARIEENLSKMPSIIDEYKAETKSKRKKASNKELTDPSKVLAAMKKSSKKTTKELTKILERQKSNK